MEALKLQATAVTAKMQQQLRANETVASVTKKALAMYTEFEDIADPYTFHVLSQIRAYATAKLAAEDESSPPPGSSPGLSRVTSTGDLGASGPELAEVAMELPEFHDAEEGVNEGLVLTVNPTRTITPANSDIGSDIDDE